jgi:gliding motility-associated-like protein
MRLYLLCLTLLLNFILHAQMQHNQLLIGAGSGIDFSTDPPSPISVETTTLNDRRNSSISDGSGNLLFYADHFKVFQADGAEMPNGTFSQFCNESIIVPDPGNSNRYYLIRSRLNSGIDYSLIDLSLNDGNGAIVEGLKEVSLTNQGGRLMTATKASSPGHWVISVDNANGSNNCWVRTYSLGVDGISFHEQSSASWAWVSWYNDIDDARISPDCSTIAVTFKGHYFGLFQYDNESGSVTNSLSASFDNLSSFPTTSRLEFSPSGQYLYTTSDNSAIVQFDLSSFNGVTINASSTTIASCGFGSCAYDVKLGRDGRIYVLNPAANSIGVINQPDEPGPQSDYIATLIDLTIQSGALFPRTANLLCTTVAFQPEVIEVCLGDETAFTLSGSANAESIIWNFGDPNASEEANTSTEANPTYTYSEPGSYNVSVEVNALGETQTFELIAVVYAPPVVTLEPSYFFCAGEPLSLEAGIADAYEWSTGATTSSISVTTSGVYSVTLTTGLCTETGTTNVTVIAPPLLNLGPNLTICDEQPVTLDADQEATWSTGEVANSIEVNEDGVYAAVVTNDCFTVSDEVSVVFISEPDFGLPGRMTGCYGDTLEIRLGLTSGPVNWSNAEGAVTTSGNTLLASESGSYTANLNYMGCPYTTEIEVEFFDFVDLDKIVMPNIFSPNNDGFNDQYRPVLSTNPGLNLCQLTVFSADLRIFNRWGTPVLENGCQWNGRDENGNELSEGVYFYMVDLASQCFDRGGQKSVSGTIDLVR